VCVGYPETRRHIAAHTECIMHEGELVKSKAIYTKKEGWLEREKEGVGVKKEGREEVGLRRRGQGGTEVRVGGKILSSSASKWLY
jgi:hypothetical protein